mmetsp:Transcript_36313/g.64999  ORF Transcript_36313/g.64999 Transcript_36313/m.64999 type:complete len:84 (-) Transcript_36313:30-281(-)
MEGCDPKEHAVPVSVDWKAPSRTEGATPRGNPHTATNSLPVGNPKCRTSPPSPTASLSHAPSGVQGTTLAYTLGAKPILTQAS